MKPAFYILLLFVLGLVSCGQKNNATNNSKMKMKLIFEVIPEDYERNLYYVAWEDTLGLSEGYQGDKWLERPKEVWCVITNDNKDTLGCYEGLSFAQESAWFQSKDTIVTLNFMIGLNVFTDKLTDKLEELNNEDFIKFVQKYLNDNHLPIIFEPIKINLKTDICKKYDIEIKEK